MDGIRTRIKEERRDELRTCFLTNTREKGRDTMALSDIMQACTDAGMHMNQTMEDEQLVWQVVEQLDGMAEGSGNNGDGLTFTDFEALFHGLSEMILMREGQKIRAVASKLGMDLHTMGQYIMAYDQLDEDTSGRLDIDEVTKALAMTMKRDPTHEEIKMLYSDLGMDVDHAELDICDFLALMENAAARKLIPELEPFTLRYVNESTQREILTLFPLSASYVNQIEHDTLQDLVSTYLNVAL